MDNHEYPGVPSTEQILRQIEGSLIAAFDWALGLGVEEDQVDALGELYTYAAIEGLDTEAIDTIYEKAFKEEE